MDLFQSLIPQHLFTYAIVFLFDSDTILPSPPRPTRGDVFSQGTTFEMEISNKLQKSLVLGTSSKQSNVKSTMASASVSDSMISTRDIVSPPPLRAFASAIGTSLVVPVLPSVTLNKLQILSEYEQQYGSSYNHSIVTTKKGSH